MPQLSMSRRLNRETRRLHRFFAVAFLRGLRYSERQYRIAHFESAQ
jgi:hypothetical protein